VRMNVLLVNALGLRVIIREYTGNYLAHKW
jgi:hypothetical protein